VFDKLVFTTIDLSPWRNGLSLLSTLLAADR
jgi:hypothetical protein